MNRIMGIRPVPPQITLDPEKATVVKLTEEAAEALNAWKSGNIEELAYELADVIQCVSSIAAMSVITDSQMRIALLECEKRNREKGRYR